MDKLSDLSDFILRFSEDMLLSGANLERVDDTVYRICESYGCQNVHFFSLNCFLSLSVEDEEGHHFMNQRCIFSSVSVHLERLHRLNQLSRDICINHPDPGVLNRMLDEASDAKGYPTSVVLVGDLIAMACLALMFGANIRDLTVILFNTILMFFAGIYIKKPEINKIVYNIACTFVTGTIAVFLVHVGFAQHIYVIMITNSMMLINGIGMVNAFRNLLCGNEINGILELFKVLIETVALVCGFIFSLYLFGGMI